MNKHKFMKILKKNIKKIPKKERNDILNEYNNHFICGEHNNQSENQICEELGNPRKIGRELQAISYMDTAKNKNHFINIFHLVLSLASLSLMNCFIVIISLFILLLLLPFIFSMIIIAILLTLSPIIFFLYTIFFDRIDFDVSDLIHTVFASFIGVCMSILLFYMIKYSYNLFINYIKWNINLVKKENSSEI